MGSFDFNSPNLKPLKAILDERKVILRRSLLNYRAILKSAAKKLKGIKSTTEYLDYVNIGRRGADKVRDVTMASLEKSFLTGNPTTLTKSELFKKITTDKSFKAVLQPDGRWTFPLEIKPYDGRIMNFDVDYYSELTARTTAHLADQESFFVDAEETGSFLKFNSTGISKSKYRKRERR